MDYSGVDPLHPIDAALGLTNTTGYSFDTTAPSVDAHAGDTLVNIWMSKGGTQPYSREDPSSRCVLTSIPTIPTCLRSWSQTRRCCRLELRARRR